MVSLQVKILSGLKKRNRRTLSNHFTKRALHVASVVVDASFQKILSGHNWLHPDPWLVLLEVWLGLLD